MDRIHGTVVEVGVSTLVYLAAPLRKVGHLVLAQSARPPNGRYYGAVMSIIHGPASGDWVIFSHDDTEFAVRALT